MIKLVVTDMDGTLLNSQGELSSKFEETYHRITNMGIRFVVASGRPHYTLVPQFSQMANHDIILVGDNGGFIGTKPEPIITKEFSYEDIFEVLEVGQQTNDVHLIICTTEKPYTQSDNKAFLNEAKKYYPNIEVIKDANLITGKVLKIAVYDPKTWELNSGETWNTFGDKHAVAKSSKVWIDIMPKGVNKGTAVKYLQKIFGIKKEETMAFGDFHNDIEMLENAQFSYSMENAHEDVKQVANYSAPSNDEDGVIKVLEQMLL